MPGAMVITFLGTSSGGGPSESRNCSSLVCDILGNGSLWMVDCAEGTLRQFAFQPKGQIQLKANRVTKIFITHMHADHIMGIVPLLRGVLFPPSTDSTTIKHSEKPPRVEIYGPSGIRNFVRQVMKMTLTNTSDTYTIHELLTPDDPSLPCLSPAGIKIHSTDPNVMHISEVAGSDIRCADDGFWRGLTESKGAYGRIFVDAGPISHRDPCIGYIFREDSWPLRKLVILGDTSNASTIAPLCLSPSPSLLVHESTDAHIPRNVDPKANRSLQVVLDKTLSRGHSIPTMAGTFAKAVGAERLVLNHISGRFPAPRNHQDHRTAIIHEIEKQATEAWNSSKSAIVAWDFMRIEIPAIMTTNLNTSDSSALSTDNTDVGSTTTQMIPLSYSDPAEGSPHAGMREFDPKTKKRRR
ncbi:beta-lactamase-like protein [Collybia nuda]|uniref:Beta-lactamase-like protein n=1 Tax=Collybia nuda TaxID=64659 RepID=A0A9P5XZJ2_9AGAR|nr:beta-lactamase-like protein [Collybia nuda]